MTREYHGSRRVRRRRPLLLLLAMLSALPLTFACGGNADRSRTTDSTAVASTLTPDTIGMQSRLASDATLVIDAMPPLHAMLRAVADSFAAREAIRVVFASSPGDSANPNPGISSAADLVIVSADAMYRLPDDSSSWVLPFAETLPDSASVARSDSLTRADSVRASARKSARRATGRRADSIRLDSLRRAAARQDSIRADRLRADSARTLVLTVPADAPNRPVAERFVRYLLTDGSATLLRSGVHLLPRLVLRGNAVPPGIASLVDTVMPPDTRAFDSTSRR